MGNTCQFSKIEKENQRIRLIGVECQQFPNKQTQLENFSYNIQENIDQFEEEFFNKSFELDIHNEKTAKSESLKTDIKEEKKLSFNSLVFVEEKQNSTQFGSYNQMASEAFGNYIKLRTQFKSQQSDRMKESVQQQIHLNNIKRFPQIYGRTQFRITDIDVQTSNSNKISKSKRGTKSNFHSNLSLNQKSNINQPWQKQERKIKIIYL
ncbi:unnamed protein product (macronuclear) [Paramecium tetraurelia]|uniref:Uncharacterized protein n=1 Tax=Paramecium tetraurelia TaxID=5888 RepID=A0DVU3_PARTE|nr:uncharacterized protein GSPATT00020813001 [Paramecium tetraurelia]CAK87160.1 unnamed protein product [Paramecium tetraurelia]|eukprot:XP_001454557.1 hypothetical protein (macronuclear) [Paramecium tetraurelia strain d4-2]